MAEEVERRNQDFRDISFRLAFQQHLPPKSIKGETLLEKESFFFAYERMIDV